MKDKKLERIENEVLGFTMEIVGCVWGLNFNEPKWSDKQLQLFNKFMSDRREASLTKIRKIYLRKVQHES